MRHFLSSLTPYIGVSDQKRFSSDAGQLSFTHAGSLWTSASGATGEPLMPFRHCATLIDSSAASSQAHSNEMMIKNV